MPSRSRTQQRLMGQALAFKRGEIKSEDFNSIISEDVRNSTKTGTEQILIFDLFYILNDIVYWQKTSFSSRKCLVT